MSLFSVFLTGDSSAIESAVKDGCVELPSSAAAQSVDFSGGIAHPHLFPDDFLALTKGGASSFWRLKNESLVEGDEHGLYCVPDAERDRLIARVQHARRVRSTETFRWRVSRREARRSD